MITVLLNPSAGGGDARNARLAALFHAAGSEAHIVELQRGQDPAEAARAASTRAPIVVAAGGDGTVSRVAAGLIGTDAALGVLPLGTLNHFAKDLHIPADPEKAVATIVASRLGHVDVGHVNDRAFINNASIGVYPSIIDARENLRRLGHRKWPAFVLATFQVLRRYRGVIVSIEVEGRQSRWRTPFVFVGNNEYEVDGTRLGGRAKLDGGRLVTYLAPRVHTRQLPIMLVNALLGRVRKSGAFKIVSAPELWIDAPGTKRIRVAIDGEMTTMSTPLHYRTSPGALKVILPSV